MHRTPLEVEYFCCNLIAYKNYWVLYPKAFRHASMKEPLITRINKLRYRIPRLNTFVAIWLHIKTIGFCIQRHSDMQARKNPYPVIRINRDQFFLRPLKWLRARIDFDVLILPFLIKFFQSNKYECFFKFIFISMNDFQSI